MNLKKIEAIKKEIIWTKKSYAEIGKKFDCSKQYVGQIAKRHNLGRKKDDTVKE